MLTLFLSARYVIRITRNTLASIEEIDYFLLTPDHSINDLPASTAYYIDILLDAFAYKED